MPIIRHMKHATVMTQEVKQLQLLHYCINCLDEVSGKQGTFAYDKECLDWKMGHVAVSPVFNTVGAFYNWAAENGFTRPVPHLMFVLAREDK